MKMHNIPYKVKDMSLAEWGRQEIKLAEAEMPGLMTLCEDHGASKPLAKDGPLTMPGSNDFGKTSNTTTYT